MTDKVQVTLAFYPAPVSRSSADELEQEIINILFYLALVEHRRLHAKEHPSNAIQLQNDHMSLGATQLGLILKITFRAQLGSPRHS